MFLSSGFVCQQRRVAGLHKVRECRCGAGSRWWCCSAAGESRVAAKGMPEQPASAKVEVKAPPAHLVDPGRWEKWAPGEPKRPQKEYGPIRVGLAMNVIRINSVDVRAQTFSAYFNVRLEWVDKYYIGGKSNYATQPDIGMAAEDWPDEDTSMQGVKISCTEFPKSRGPRWRPHIKFTNSVEPLEEQQRDYNVDADTGRVTLYYEAVGTFSEMMELNYFPFDRQLLTIEVTTPHRIDKCMFIPHREPNGYKGALVTNEWQVSCTESPATPAHFTLHTPHSTLHTSYR